MARTIIASSDFWSRVDKEVDAPCWTWKGGFTKEGYGISHGAERAIYAHRYAYELHVGPIPEGLHLDHLCRNRACCNPAHLEPVTCRENVRRSPTALAAINARKTHCDHGHEFTPQNTRTDRAGNRFCKACGRKNAGRQTVRRKIDRHRENAAAVIAAGGPCLHRSKRGNICTLPQGHSGAHHSLFPLTEVPA